MLPTVLEACGLPVPESSEEAGAVHGASMLPTFNDPQAPDPRSTQYFELLGSRSIVADGWKTGTLYKVRIDAGRRRPPSPDVIRTALQAE